MISNKCVGRNNSLKHRTESALPVYKKNTNAPIQSTRIKVNKSKLEVTTPLTTSRKTRKLHNCLSTQTFSACNKTPSSLKRKSISLVELTCNSQIWTSKTVKSKEQGDEEKLINMTLLEKTNISYSSNMEEVVLARKVCKMFMLHAWRRCRSQVITLKNKTQDLEKAVDNLNLQTALLRKLLNSEQLRVTEAMRDSANLRSRLENELNTIQGLKNQLNLFETEKALWENTHTLIDSENKSLKEKLNLCNGKIKDLKEESTCFQNNWYNSREKESQLLNKLEQAEVCLQVKICELQNTLQKLITFQSEIAKQVAVNEKLKEENENKDKKLAECIMKIRNMDGELNNLQNTCKVQNENIRNLSKDFAVAKKLIHDKNETEKSLRDTILKYKSEKEDFNRNMLKLRNQVIFEAIKISASLLLPIPRYVLM